MSASPASLQDTMAAIAVLVSIGAIMCVVYWRTALRVFFAVVIAIVIYWVAIVIYGLAWLMTRVH